jgi:Crp-like helix-turn-helix domain
LLINDEEVERLFRQKPAGEFIGEESIAGVVGLRLATATAISGCTALQIDRDEMLRVLHEEHASSDLFLKFLLARSMRSQAYPVDQLFNSSEKRLARVLLLMAEFDKTGKKRHLPKITQEALAEIIGTTRSRVSFFMNRFRDLGFIEYNGQILVHYVESGQIASLSCWLAAAAPTAWVSRPHSGLLRPECQAGFRSHLRSCKKHGFELRRPHDAGVDNLLPLQVECLHL